MKNNKHFEVIIIGGSYSGLAAAMALGRALRNILIIDSGKPCNMQTPNSHNFITQDGSTPKEIATLAKQQVAKYKTVQFLDGLATKGFKTNTGFEIETSTGEMLRAKKVIFATGIKDIMPEIDGFAECWGVCVLHCSYCHGYEIRNEKTGILSNGEHGFEFCKLIYNWTKDLTLYTNGKSTLTVEQTLKLGSHGIKIVETEMDKLNHQNGYVQNVHFKDGTTNSMNAMYAPTSFKQHCTVPDGIRM